MSKDPCCAGCDGCVNLLIESLVFIGVFAVAIVSTIWPLVM